jgi:hypothetical protein
LRAPPIHAVFVVSTTRDQRLWHGLDTMMVDDDAADDDDDDDADDS